MSQLENSFHCTERYKEKVTVCSHEGNSCSILLSSGRELKTEQKSAKVVLHIWTLQISCIKFKIITKMLKTLIDLLAL